MLFDRNVGGLIWGDWFPEGDSTGQGMILFQHFSREVTLCLDGLVIKSY